MNFEGYKNNFKFLNFWGIFLKKQSKNSSWLK